jgi:hypothetical protein
MIELASLIARFGLPAAAGAVILFVILKGELRFRYPRRKWRLQAIALPLPRQMPQQPNAHSRCGDPVCDPEGRTALSLPEKRGGRNPMANQVYAPHLARENSLNPSNRGRVGCRIK